MTKLYVTAVGFLIGSFVFGQVAELTTGGYTQSFGSADIGSWTNNSTFPGWYYSANASFQGHQDIVTSGSPSNNGGTYSYECNGNNNQKIGTRPSNAIGSANASGAVLRFGVILTNTSGQTIHSVNVSFTAYQFSVVDNGNIDNYLEFHWAKGSPSVSTDLLTGSYTAVPALTFLAPENRATTSNTSLQQARPCTLSSAKSACINIPGGLANGAQIVLRWSDINNSNNDPHLGIDDLTVTGFASGTSVSNPCVSPLPVTLVSFEARCNGSDLIFDWTTNSERNNDYFTLESTEDGISFETLGKVKGAGNSDEILNYSLQAAEAGDARYFRLKQTDFNGESSHSNVIYADCHLAGKLKLYPNPNNGSFRISGLNEGANVSIRNEIGQLVNSFTVSGTNIEVHELAKGVYFVESQSESGKRVIEKVVVH